MHIRSQEKLRKLRSTQFKRQKKQKRRPWVNFSVSGEAAGPIYFPKDRKRSQRFCLGQENGDTLLSPFYPILGQENGDMLLYPHFFPVQFHHEGTPHQDMHLGHFVLFCICLRLDKWGVLLFSLLYVVRLQYFPSSF